MGFLPREPVEGRVDFPEKFSGVPIPPPGEVQGDLAQTFQRLGQIGDLCSF